MKICLGLASLIATAVTQTFSIPRDAHQPGETWRVNRLSNLPPPSSVAKANCQWIQNSVLGFDRSWPSTLAMP